MQSDIEVRLQQHGDGMHATHSSPRDASLVELFKSLTADSAELVRQEIDLAKSEANELASNYTRDAAQVGVAAGMAFVGVLALSAFLVIGLGNVMGGRYWLSSLIVGVIAAAAGYSMVSNAVKNMKSHSWKPRATMASLREGKAWAGQEAREFKEDLTSNPSTQSPRY